MHTPMFQMDPFITYRLGEGLIAGALLLALVGCAGVVAQPPISPGQSVQLQPGEGIVALLMDSQDPLTQVRLESLNAKDPALDLESKGVRS